MCRGRRPRSAPTLATACPLCTPPPQTCRLCPCPRHAHDAWSLYTGRGRGQGEGARGARGARGAVRVRLIQPAHLPRHRDQISDHDVDDATPHSSFHGGTTHVARAHTPHSWRHNTTSQRAHTPKEPAAPSEQLTRAAGVPPRRCRTRTVGWRGCPVPSHAPGRPGPSHRAGPLPASQSSRNSIPGRKATCPEQPTHRATPLAGPAAAASRCCCRGRCLPPTLKRPRAAAPAVAAARVPFQTSHAWPKKARPWQARATSLVATEGERVGAWAALVTGRVVCLLPSNRHDV